MPSIPAGLRGLRKYAAKALAVTLAVIASVLPPAGAATTGAFPDRPVTLVVPYGPGGVVDIAARSLAEGLGKLWGQTVVVDNRAGAAGVIGAAMVARAEGDGYTLLCVDDGVMVSMPHFNKEMPYDTLRDLQPVAMVGTYPYVFFANAQAGYKTLDQVVAASKAKPGSVNYGTNGVGSIQHLAVERFQRQAQIRLNHIPYKSGNPALQDLVGGQIPTAIVALATGSPYLNDPRVIPLAVTDTQRTPLRPDLPTARELGYDGFTTLSWLAMFAPRTAPPALVDKINDAVATVVASDAYRNAMSARGVTAQFKPSKALREQVAIEFDRNGADIRSLEAATR